VAEIFEYFNGDEFIEGTAQPPFLKMN